MSDQSSGYLWYYYYRYHFAKRPRLEQTLRGLRTDDALAMLRELKPDETVDRLLQLALSARRRYRTQSTAPSSALRRTTRGECAAAMVLCVERGDTSGFAEALGSFEAACVRGTRSTRRWRRAMAKRYADLFVFVASVRSPAMVWPETHHSLTGDELRRRWLHEVGCSARSPSVALLAFVVYHSTPREAIEGLEDSQS